jgi:transposase
MTTLEQVVHRLLDLPPSWRVFHMEFERETNTCVIGVQETKHLWEEESRRAGQKVICHDHRDPRQWRHLNVLGKACVIVCAVPRARRTGSGEVYPIVPPWKGRSECFTKEFEALALTLMKEMPVSKAGEILGERHPQVLWQMLSAHCEVAPRDRLGEKVAKHHS